MRSQRCSTSIECEATWETGIARRGLLEAELVHVCTLALGMDQVVGAREIESGDVAMKTIDRHLELLRYGDW